MNNQKAIFAALAISVVLNAGLIGFMAARMNAAPTAPRLFARDALGELGLAEQQLKEARHAMRERRNAYREHAAELHEAQKKAAELLRVDEFDEAALDQAFAEIRRIHGEAERLMQDSVIELARGMEPRARERLAQYVERLSRDRNRRQPPRTPPRAPRPENAPQNSPETEPPKE